MHTSAPTRSVERGWYLTRSCAVTSASAQQSLPASEAASGRLASEAAGGPVAVRSAVTASAGGGAVAGSKPALRKPPRLSARASVSPSTCACACASLAVIGVAGSSEVPANLAAAAGVSTGMHCPLSLQRPVWPAGRGQRASRVHLFVGASMEDDTCLCASRRESVTRLSRARLGRERRNELCVLTKGVGGGGGTGSKHWEGVCTSPFSSVRLMGCGHVAAGHAGVAPSAAVLAVLAPKLPELRAPRSLNCSQLLVTRMGDRDPRGGRGYLGRPSHVLFDALAHEEAALRWARR